MGKKAIPFFAGILAGLGMGIAAMSFLSSEKGKQFRQQAAKTMADFYQEMAAKSQDLKEMSEQQYREFMKTAVKKYVATKHISKDIARYLYFEAQKSWDYLSDRWQAWREA